VQRSSSPRSWDIKQISNRVIGVRTNDVLDEELVVCCEIQKKLTLEAITDVLSLEKAMFALPNKVINDFIYLYLKD